jgi:antirestriction protein ArdC
VVFWKQQAGDQAFYRPAADSIQLPPLARFKNATA